MEFYIGESGSSGRKFDNLEDFLKAITDLVSTYKESGETWFEIEVING